MFMVWRTGTSPRHGVPLPPGNINRRGIIMGHKWGTILLILVGKVGVINPHLVNINRLFGGQDNNT